MRGGGGQGSRLSYLSLADHEDVRIMIDAVLRPPLPQAREELRVSAVADESVDKYSIVVLWDWVRGRVKSRVGLRVRG